MPPEAASLHLYKEGLGKMDEIKENWLAIKDVIRREYTLSDISYKTWVHPLEYYNVVDDVVNIIVPSSQAHMLNYISSKYKSFFQVTITEMFDNHNYDVNFILESDIVKAAEEDISPSPTLPVYNINYENANLNPKYKFDTFVVGSNNEFAHSAALAVAESPGNAYNPLYLYGGPGLGKTHLMHSIGHFILEQFPDKKVIYVTSEDFTNEVIESIRGGNKAVSMAKLREKYRTVDVLMIDDIQFIIGKESTQEEFFHTFNVLHSAGKQIILTSDKPPKDIETLEERIRSRFEWGLMADIGVPDYETRMAILRRKVESDEIELSDEILNYIANNIKSNIRELEGALNKLLAFGNLVQTEITMEIAQKELQNIITPDKPREITPQLIIEVVADHFQISIDQMISKTRSKDIAKPRQIAMYLCKNMTNTPLDSIGAVLGGRDHSTIIHGINKITEEYDADENIRNIIMTIKKKINPN